MAVTRRGITKHLLFFALSLVLYAMSAMAQLTDTGTIVGTVYDPSHAAVPQANVTITNEGTNIQQTATTDSKGEYVVPSLRVGTYTLKVEKTGFETPIQKGIIVNVQSRVQVDVVMQLGATTQQLEVTAVSPLLHTQNAEVANVVESKKMEDLPLNGRNYDTLAYLTAGVFIPTGNLTTSAGEGYYNINGNSASQNNYILDGADNNSMVENFQGRSAQAGEPPLDAMAEFKVQTRTYDAEFGRAAGGIINAQIKSGSNQLHGDVWEFLRNSDLDGNNFFDNMAGETRPPYRRNQFGGTVGGPIVRQKAFIFGAFEGTRISQGEPLVGTVPTPLMQQYNFTEFPASAVPTSPVIAGLPQYASCINKGIVKASCIDPVGAKLLALYPSPNTNLSEDGVPGAFTGNNYISSPSIVNNLNNGVVRADQKIGESNSLFEHYTVVDEIFDFPSIFEIANPLADGGGNGQNSITNARRQNTALGFTHIFSPTTLLDLRAGWNRIAQHTYQLDYGKFLDADSQLGLTGVPQNPNVSGGLPYITPSGFNQLGGQGWQPMTEISYVWDFRGILTKIKGSHALKAGVEVRRDSWNYLDNCCDRGSYNFSGQYSQQGITDMLLGLPNDVELTSVAIGHKYINGLSPFVQDTWRATSKLTLDYGLRWEYASPFLERNNRMSNFNPGGLGGEGEMFTATSGSVSQRATINPYYKGFAPRAGLAYRINDRLVFRGGYGIYYDNYDRRGNAADLALNPPFFIDHAGSSPSGQAPPFLLQSGFGANWLAAPNFADPSTLGPFFLRAVTANPRAAMIQQSSAGFEYSITPTLLLSTSWVGNYGHRLWRNTNINQKVLTTPGQASGDIPFPAYRVDPTLPPVDTLPTPIQMLTSDGNSNYEAWVLSVEKRFSHGLSFLASYTVSKNLTDFAPELESSAGAVNTLGRSDESQDAHNRRADWGLAVQDTPQRLVLSYSYAVPVGKGTGFANSGVAGKLLERWQINGIATFQGGQPITIVAPFDTSQTGQVRGEGRGDCTKTPAKITRSVNEDFDVTAFAVPALYNFGSCSIAPGVRTRGLADYDMSFFKEFPITEYKHLEFRAEFFNLLNHTQFGPPGNDTVGTPGFGAITSVAVPPREIQFALKFYF